MKLLTLLASLSPFLAASQVRAASVTTPSSLGSDRIFIIALGAILIAGAWLGRCTSRRS